MSDIISFMDSIGFGIMLMIIVWLSFDNTSLKDEIKDLKKRNKQLEDRFDSYSYESDDTDE